MTKTCYKVACWIVRRPDRDFFVRNRKNNSNLPTSLAGFLQGCSCLLHWRQNFIIYGKNWFGDVSALNFGDVSFAFERFIYKSNLRVMDIFSSKCFGENISYWLDSFLFLYNSALKKGNQCCSLIFCFCYYSQNIFIYFYFGVISH